MEHIISFLNDQEGTNNQFQIEITGISYPDPHYHVERMNSRIYCLEYVMEGEGVVAIDDQVIYPSKGDIYILPAGHEHRYHSSTTNPWKKIWMNVYGPLCDALMDTYQLEGIYWVKELDLYELFQKFVTICENKEIPVNVLLQQCSLVFHEILSSISLHLYDKPNKRNSAASKVKQYIDQHIHEKFVIAELAEIACLSPSQLNRVFKAEFKQTPYDYILTRKIDTAKLLLLNTGLNIKQTCYQLQFSDEHYFSNVFKVRTGVSPKEFIGQNKSGR